MKTTHPLFPLWQRTQALGTAPDAATWSREVRLLEQYGKGMEEAFRYLYSDKPAFDDFANWLGEVKENDMATLHEDVLSPADIDFWNENGYVVVRNAVTPAQASAAADAIWQHLGANPNDAATWYQRHEDLRGLMLTFYHHPALAENRRSPRIRRAYEQVYGNTAITANIDKVSFNPPVNDSYTFMGSPLHWDVSLKLPIPFKCQGLLYLTNTDATNGAFHCVPGFHRTIDDWVNAQPKGANLRDLAMQALEPVPVPGKAGDFIIWHQALPHCATPNTGTTPRLVQYFTYLQDGVIDQDEWI